MEHRPQFFDGNAITRQPRASGFNPWEFLDSAEKDDVLSIVSTDEDLWAHLWPTFPCNIRSKFWASYWTKEAKEERIVTVSGGATRSKKLRSFLMPISLAQIKSDQANEAIHKILGEWLNDVINDPETGVPKLRAMARTLEEMKSGERTEIEGSVP